MLGARHLMNTISTIERPAPALGMSRNFLGKQRRSPDGRTAFMATRASPLVDPNSTPSWRPGGRSFAPEVRA